jgi:hypothetical protein
MTCSGRYANAWAYASFWCVGSLITGLDDSGGAGNPALQDLSAKFVNAGLRAQEGMVIYNTTQGTSGEITAVSQTALTATGVTWDNGDAYRAVAIDAAQIATIEHYLNVTAGNIKMAMESVGACDCTLSTSAYNGNLDGSDFLGKLNIVEAGSFHTCPCAVPGQRMTDEQRRLWLTWSNEQLTYIRSGEIELCDGATGVTYPVTGWASQAHTEFNAARIIANRVRRYG